MKKLLFVLATAVLLFLTACNGPFLDPGTMDMIGGGINIGGGGGSGGSGGSGGGGSGGGGVGGGLFDKPAVPTGVKATAESSSSIKISWNEVSGLYISYNVYRSRSSSGSYEKIDDTYSTSYTDTGLSSNTAYYYKVTAKSLLGEESDKSSSVSATTKR